MSLPIILELRRVETAKQAHYKLQKEFHPQEMIVKTLSTSQTWLHRTLMSQAPSGVQAEWFGGHKKVERA